MIARWDEFAPTYYDRKQSAYVVAKMWQQMPAHMLRKCAEAGSLRMAAPQDLSGVYVDEEMERADAEAVVREAEDATRRLRVAAGLEAGGTSNGEPGGDPPRRGGGHERGDGGAEEAATSREEGAQDTGPGTGHRHRRRRAPGCGQARSP